MPAKIFSNLPLLSDNDVAMSTNLVDDSDFQVD